MSKTFAIGMAAVALAVAVPAVSLAAEVTAGADVVSAYIWRGLTYNDGVVVQPSVDVAHPSGLGLNVWGNFDMTDYDGAVDEREFSEVDLTLSYAVPIEGPVSITVGISEWLYPKEGNYTPELPEAHAAVEAKKDTDTREVYLNLGYEPMDGLALGMSLNQDIDEVEGTYGDASIAYTYEPCDKTSLEASARIGVGDKKFAEYYAGGTKGGLFDWGAKLTATYALSESTELAAFVAYTDNLNDDVFPDDAKDVDVYGGMSLYYTF